MAKRDYFTFYRSFYEQISDCDDPEARREMYEVLLDYAFNKTEPDFNAEAFNPITKFFWIGVKPVMAKNWAQYENGCKGGAPIGNTNNKGKKRVNPKLTQSQAYIDKDKEEDKDKEIDIEGERDEDVFRPPSLEEVLFYCSSIHGADDDGQAKKFFNYYAARGWKMSNGATMADWRAAFESWCNREKEFNHIHTCNNENDKPTSEQRGTGFGQLQEQPNRETGLNGQGAGIDDAIW